MFLTHLFLTLLYIDILYNKILSIHWKLTTFHPSTMQCVSFLVKLSTQPGVLYRFWPIIRSSLQVLGCLYYLSCFTGWFGKWRCQDISKCIFLPCRRQQSYYNQIEVMTCETNLLENYFLNRVLWHEKKDLYLNFWQLQIMIDPK